MILIDTIQNLIQKPIPLPEKISKMRANCFNAVQLYFGDVNKVEFTDPEAFVRYIQSHFKQIEINEKQNVHDVIIVWSRSNNQLPVGQIITDHLRRENQGYPFGLIIEHAFIFTQPDSDEVFQKRDLSETGPYEIISQQVALAPYIDCCGFEITRHRRIRN